MNKRPVFVSLGICFVILSILTMYFTMYANANGLELFLNKVPKKTSEDIIKTSDKNTASPKTATPIPQTSAPNPVETEKPYIDVKISTVGDLLIHENILKAQYNESDKTYDFSNIFSEISSYISASDLAVASLEVPLGGEQNGGYTGFPKFNCPDQLIDALKNTGFSLLLTAGTHAFDRDTAGFTRTIDTIAGKGMQSTGTVKNAETDNYIIKDVKGVKIGIINYTAAERRSSGRISINGKALIAEQEKLINIFEYDKIEDFYNKAQQNISKMKTLGAEAIIFYLRWGTDYTTVPDNDQKGIAQKLCDMGVDLIIGNGPHMIQPFEVLKSQNGQRNTLCIYSLGNFVSNQRKEAVDYKSGHTEDGLIYTVNIRKYRDGKTEIMNIDYIPTWVYLETDSQSGKYKYTVMNVKYINNLNLNDAKESNKRTEAVIKDKIYEYNGSLAIDDGTS